MDTIIAKEDQFSAEVQNDFIHLKTWGRLELDNLDAPVNAAITLAQDKSIDKLLDDIREVDTSDVSLHVQAKGMSVLWKLRTFRKVAIVFKGREIGMLLFSSLEALHLHLDSRFKGFDNEAEAIKWLEED